MGYPGSGKSHRYAELCEQIGEDEIYLVSDYSTAGGFDMYEGQKVLFMDEYKAQLSYDTLLSICDIYRKQLHARYSNVWMLWSEIYITSVFSPEDIYEKTVPEEQRINDPIRQWLRRIDDITYCWVENGEYRRYTIPMSEYRGYSDLHRRATKPPEPPEPPLFAASQSQGERGEVGASVTPHLVTRYKAISNHC